MMGPTIGYFISMIFLGIYTIAASYWGWEDPGTIQMLSYVMFIPVVNILWLGIGFFYYFAFGIVQAFLWLGYNFYEIIK